MTAVALIAVVLSALSPTSIGQSSDSAKVRERATMITLSYQGGARRPPLPCPLLTIYATGNRAGELEIRLPQETIRSRLDPKVINEVVAWATAHNFFAWNSAELATSVRQSILASGRRLPRLLDLATTSISIQTETRPPHAVACYALSEYAQRAPEHHELRHLARLTHWLEAVVANVVKLRGQADEQQDRKQTTANRNGITTIGMVDAPEFPPK